MTSTFQHNKTAAVTKSEIFISSSPILVLADDLPGDGDVEGPDLLAGRDDLVGGKEEAEHAGVPQLHADAKRKKM